MVAIGALLAGGLMVVMGLAGLATPDLFTAVVAAVQQPPLLYAAAVVRALVGALLLLAARGSRHPLVLRVIGLPILAGGLLTPWIGPSVATVVLGWWSDGGPAVVRVFGAGSLALGAFVIHAVRAPARKPA